MLPQALQNPDQSLQHGAKFLQTSMKNCVRWPHILFTYVGLLRPKVVNLTPFNSFWDQFWTTLGSTLIILGSSLGDLFYKKWEEAFNFRLHFAGCVFYCLFNGCFMILEMMFKTLLLPKGDEILKAQNMKNQCFPSGKLMFSSAIIKTVYKNEDMKRDGLGIEQKMIWGGFWWPLASIWAPFW